MARAPFEYLLNAMEHASMAENPAASGYAAARRAVLDYVEQLARDRDVVMHEAFMTGRLYASGGEKERPSEIHVKLSDNCERAVRMDRATRAKVG